MNEEILNKKLKKLHKRMLFALSLISTPLMYAIDKIMGIDMSLFHYLFIFFLTPLVYYI
jgi:type III secretory pathway component EscU